MKEINEETIYELPFGISEMGVKGYQAIMEFLRKKDLVWSGFSENGRVFQAPKAANQVLIVSYEGSKHGKAFSYDYGQYSIVEAMEKELEKIGLYSEQINSTSSGIYVI